jgi:hypothetical protein
MEAIKPFKETKVGQFLKNDFPQVLNTIGDVLPSNGVFGIVKNLIKLTPGISPAQQSEAIAKIEAFEKEYFAMEMQDRDSARDLQSNALKQEDKFSKRFIYFLSAFVIGAATTFGIMLFFVEVPKENQRMVEMFADIFLFTGALTILNFYFGSSKESHEKTKMLNEKN